jgi:hypothetical protein
VIGFLSSNLRPVTIATTSNTSQSAASEDEHETKQEQPTGKAECQGRGCSTPPQSNDKAGGEVADGVDRSQRSECSASGNEKGPISVPTALQHAPQIDFE